MNAAASYRVAKRLGDLVVAVLGLALGLPLLALVALAVAAEGARPVLFRQRRAGRDGQPFEVFKFRTLYAGPHDPTNPSAHVTRVGRFLRRWGLDELPQLWNVLRGEMSLVGPRPTLPEQVAAYGPRERRRLAVRPGLTGWAQIHGRNALSWPERIALDLWYVDHACFGLDLRILLRTPRLLWTGEGVYGTEGRNKGFSPRHEPPTLSHESTP